MKKALNTTQTIIESVLQSAVLTLIVLGFIMAITSCSTSSHYSKKKPYKVSNKSHGRCVGGTCYAF
jgi:hypothetical protein